jgi:WD40 repeat protein
MTVIEGRPIIVTGGRVDGTVRRWTDLDVDLPKTELGFRTSFRSISAVAAAVVSDDRQIIITNDGTKTGITDWLTQRWDAGTDNPIGEPLNQSMFASALAVGAINDRSVILSGGADGKVHRWDAISGQPIGDPLMPTRSHVGGITSIAIGTVDEQTVVAAGYWDGQIAVWDAISGETPFFKNMKTGWHWNNGALASTYMAPIRALAIATVADQPLIIFGGDDGILRCLHATSHNSVGHRTGGQGRLCSIACGIADGCPIIVTGGTNGIVACRDARSGDVVSWWRGALKPFSVENEAAQLHPADGMSVAVGICGSRPLIVSGAPDGTVLRVVGLRGDAVVTSVSINARVTGVCILPKGRVAVASRAGLLLLDFHHE